MREEAGEKRIILRDLKPANIVWTGKCHAKVMDFGLAMQLIPLARIESHAYNTARRRKGFAFTFTGRQLGGI